MGSLARPRGIPEKYEFAVSRFNCFQSFQRTLGCTISWKFRPQSAVWTSASHKHYDRPQWVLINKQQFFICKYRRKYLQKQQRPYKYSDIINMETLRGPSHKVYLWIPLAKRSYMVFALLTVFFVFCLFVCLFACCLLVSLFVCLKFWCRYI